MFCSGMEWTGKRLRWTTRNDQNDAAIRQVVRWYTAHFDLNIPAKVTLLSRDRRNIAISGKCGLEAISGVYSRMYTTL